MSLQDKLDAFKSDFRAGKPPYNAPPDIHPVMERATAELIASGQAGRALKAGDGAPRFSLRDQNGPVLASAPPEKPLLATQAYDQQLKDADALIDRVVRENLPRGGR